MSLGPGGADYVFELDPRKELQDLAEHATDLHG
jgi:hypothetical protein